MLETPKIVKKVRTRRKMSEMSDNIGNIKNVRKTQSAPIVKNLMVERTEYLPPTQKVRVQFPVEPV